MFWLIWFLFTANSDAGSIKLKEPMIVHTNDGDKYLYNPSKTDLKTGEKPQNRLSKLSENTESITELESIDLEMDKNEDDTCTWGEWGEFTKCESIGEFRNCHFPLFYSCVGRQYM